MVISSRLVTVWLSLVVCALVAAGCRQVITRDPPPPPPFPPEIAAQATTQSGLTFRAEAEVVSTAPTAIRVTGFVTNPTAEDIVAQTLRAECHLIVAATWPDNSEGRLVQPLDGLGPGPGGPLGVCGTQTGTRTIAAGETVEIVKAEDLVLSEVLGSAFVPGRYIISAIFVDLFIYEVLAADLDVED